MYYFILAFGFSAWCDNIEIPVGPFATLIWTLFLWGGVSCGASPLNTFGGEIIQLVFLAGSRLTRIAI
jgi:hypothetical protein